MLYEMTGNVKSQDGGLRIGNAYISAARQDSKEIPTAIPMFNWNCTISSSAYKQDNCNCKSIFEVYGPRRIML
jgi:hypothetical protein